MNLYHYFEKGNTPFLTLSDLPDEIAKKIQDSLKENENVYSKRDYDGKYMHYRRLVENNVRSAFIEKGGNPTRKTPVYFILGETHAKNHIVYREWFKNVDFVEIPIAKCVINAVSFTYGDSFIENHPEHHDQTQYHKTVHTYEEILEIIKQYGWPQDSVKKDSPFWIPRYIEAQLWSDKILNKYRTE